MSTSVRRRTASVWGLLRTAQCRVRVNRSGSVFRFIVVEAISLAFVTVVGSQVEINDDFHLLGKYIEDILLKKRVPDGFGRVKVELRSKVTQDVRAGRVVLASVAECRNRGFVGGRADEGLVDVFGVRSACSSRLTSNTPVSVLRRTLRSWSSQISLSACWLCLVTLQQANLSTNRLCEGLILPTVVLAISRQSGR
jgi:hypothetical protein